MRQQLKKKLRSRAGETLAETMVAMVIMVLGMMLLAGAIVTAAKVNAQARDQNSWGDTVNSASDKVTVTASYDGTTQDFTNQSFHWYETGNGGLYFYGD